MSLKTFVKIGKIDNLSDARYCAGMMADILGFNIEEGTEGYVSPEKFKEITDWVAGVKFCGEFSHAQAAEVKLASTQYALDLIEVKNPDMLEELSGLGKELILKCAVHNDADLKKLPAQIAHASEFVSYIIVDSTKPELSNAIQSLLTETETDAFILRGYDLSVASAPEVAAGGVFQGIELEGSPEDRPGFKDYGTVMDILEVLEED